MDADHGESSSCGGVRQAGGVCPCWLAAPAWQRQYNCGGADRHCPRFLLRCQRFPAVAAFITRTGWRQWLQCKDWQGQVGDNGCTARTGMLTLVICHGCLLDALAFCMLCHQLPRILYLWKLGHLAAVRVGEQEGSMKGGHRVQVQRVPAAAT